MCELSMQTCAKFGMQTGIMISNGRGKANEIHFTGRKKVVWPNKIKNNTHKFFFFLNYTPICSVIVFSSSCVSFFCSSIKLLSYVSIIYVNNGKLVSKIAVNQTKPAKLTSFRDLIAICVLQ